MLRYWCLLSACVAEDSGCLRPISFSFGRKALRLALVRRVLLLYIKKQSPYELDCLEPPSEPPVHSYRILFVVWLSLSGESAHCSVSLQLILHALNGESKHAHIAKPLYPHVCILRRTRMYIYGKLRAHL
jgi:hypothetical protein